MKAICNIVFLLLIGTSQQLQAQSGETPAEVSNLFKVNFFLPGISYEQKVFSLATLNMDAYMDGLIVSKSESANAQPHVYFTPSFKTEFRTYYNLRTRHAKGLRTAQNNGEYFAPLYMGRYSSTGDYQPHTWVSQVGAVWGIQRNAPKGFSIDFNAGLVYTFNARYYQFYDPTQIVVQLRLGYWIGKKSK